MSLNLIKGYFIQYIMETPKYIYFLNVWIIYIDPIKCNHILVSDLKYFYYILKHENTLY